ncbi:MAG TPA: DUF2252 domain-containing protein [Candidatus Acidoferrales bacterium]|nr:DUF2252 domain-containing protein [Candidatus Acidoferrales bacterium]
MMASVAERIRRFNQGRDPERLRRKYQAMRQSPFIFLRGTCHLFAADWPHSAALNAAPLAWICGDLHFENLGAFKGDNRLEYFDLNDFDDAILGPCTWDVARFLTSLLVGTRSLGLQRRQARDLCRQFLTAYAAALADGKARWVERETATGMVKDLLTGLQSRKRKQLLKRRTLLHGGRRRTRVDGVYALPASTADRRKITAFMEGFAARQPRPEFFKVLDTARRIAGTGSLGVERYAILVEGKGSPQRNFLIDLKSALPSAWQPYLRVAQPAWRTEAERVVAVQHRAQAASPALLQAVDIGPTSFVLRELQPREDRLSLGHWQGKWRRLETVMTTMGEIVAWAQLRGSGRQGAAVADAFIDFARQQKWQRPLLDYAESYSRRVEGDWRSFCEAFDAGFFG